MQNRRLAIIAAIVFVDLLGFSLILPLLPYYASAFGASEIAVSLLAAAYAAGQFIGAPARCPVSCSSGSPNRWARPSAAASSSG